MAGSFVRDSFCPSGIHEEFRLNSDAFSSLFSESSQLGVGFHASLLVSEEQHLDLEKCNWANGDFWKNKKAQIKLLLIPQTALGGFSGKNYSEASAFIITYPVNNAINKEGNEIERAVAWEKAFIELAKDELLQMVQSKNLTLSFSSKSSIEEELKSESTADVITILVHEGAFGSIGDDQSLLKYLESLGQHQ